MMDLLSSLLVPSQEKLAEAYESHSTDSGSTSLPRTKRQRFDEVGEMGATQEQVLTDRTAPPAVPSALHQRLNAKNQTPNRPATYKTGKFADLDLQAIEEFDRLHPHIPKLKPRSPPEPAKSEAPKLVPITSNKINSNSVATLNTLCQTRGLGLSYEFSGDQSIGGFSAQVSFGAYTIRTDNLFPSKKNAKAAVAKLALERVERFPQLQPVAGTKRKSIDACPGVDRSENWVGTLVEYSQKKRLDYPQYQEYVTETVPFQFGCTVTLPGTSPTPFGSDLGPYKSKSDAKAAAAKAACTWLRSQGLMPESLAKRRRMSDVDPLLTGAETSNVDTDIPATKPMTAPERLHFLVGSMKLVCPRLDCRRAMTKDGQASADVPLYDAALYFDDRAVKRDPRLAGPIGQVQRIHGQKKAREACCEQALPLLEEVRRTWSG